MFNSTFNFHLGETIDALRDTARAFAQKEIAPLAAEIDRSNEFPPAVVEKNGRSGPAGYYR